MSITQMRKDDFYLPILKTLDELGGSGSVEEIDNRVIELTCLSDGDLSVRYEKSNALMVPDKISWGRSYLRMAGLIQSETKGLWVLTEEGRNALAEGDASVHTRVAHAVKEYHKAYNAKAAEKRAASKAAIEESGENAEAEWSDQLLAKIQSIDPYAFERLSQRLLRKNGFTQVEVTGKSGDGGIDGKGVVRVNLVSFHVLFQCKRYQGSVSAGTVRDFRGAMQGRADKGLIITTGTFTPDARREATRDGAPAIDLIDGQALCQLLKENRLGVSVEMVEQVSLVPEFYDEI
jgi:restriction system protein